MNTFFDQEDSHESTFACDQRIRFAMMDINQEYEETCASPAEREAINLIGRSQGCAFRNCQFGPNQPSTSTPRQKYTLKYWYKDPRPKVNANSASSAICRYHFEA